MYVSSAGEEDHAPYTYQIILSSDLCKNNGDCIEPVNIVSQKVKKAMVQPPSISASLVMHIGYLGSIVG